MQTVVSSLVSPQKGKMLVLLYLLVSCGPVGGLLVTQLGKSRSLKFPSMRKFSCIGIKTKIFMNLHQTSPGYLKNRTYRHTPDLY